MTMRISIALATCNGTRFLPALLDSLATQTLPPHELVASDDASTDDTLHCLETFARRSSFPVRILRNREALGVVANFGQALSACAGDCIALADQDDVWHAAKLEKLAAALAMPGTLAVFSDADVVDENLTPLGYTMWQRVHFTAQEQNLMARGDGFGILLKHRVVTGATLACKVGFRGTALPIPHGWPHDAWLALLAAAQDGLTIVQEPLIAYRQHDANLVGGRRKTLMQEFRAGLQLDRSAWYRQELGLWRALDARLATLPATVARTVLADKIVHLETRAQLPGPRWRRIPGILREALSGRYARHARNWGSIAIDLLVR